jgi:hypothetical protein
MARVAVVVLAAGMLLPALPARADETDNFTCRTRALRDSLAALDTIMNVRIDIALARANARMREGGCDDECLARALQAAIASPDRHPLTGVPHARFERWIAERRDVDRCRVRFRESIYGAKPYNQPWLFPFTGRIILLADSIRLSDTTVGIDKINHFIREGLEHWKGARTPGRSIDDILRQELGAPGRQLRWNEYGLKGWSLTGVLSYADLAAGYAGFRFWSDVTEPGRPSSLIARDSTSGEFIVRRRFTFADYVNDAWDESLNCSVFHPDLAREVAAALAKRSLSCPAADASSLASLPDAHLYVNPRYFPDAGFRSSFTFALPDFDVVNAAMCWPSMNSAHDVIAGRCSTSSSTSSLVTTTPSLRSISTSSSPSPFCPVGLSRSAFRSVSFGLFDEVLSVPFNST